MRNDTWSHTFWWTLFPAECNLVRSLISKAKSSFLSNLSTESSANPRTLWKPLNTILHRNPFLQTHFHCPQMHPTSTTHSLTVSKTKFIVSAPNFYHLIPLIRFFFHLPRLQSWSLLFQSLSLKFANSFLLLKVNSVPWFHPNFLFETLLLWTKLNLVQSSHILSISLFL